MPKNSTLVLTPVVDSEDVQYLTNLATELSTKMNDVVDLIRKIEDSDIKVELHLSQR